jgi:hypothetical protein
MLPFRYFVGSDVEAEAALLECLLGHHVAIIPQTIIVGFATVVAYPVPEQVLSAVRERFRKQLMSDSVRIYSQAYGEKVLRLNLPNTKVVWFVE